MPTGPLRNTRSASRSPNGADTDVNAADLTVGAPTPQNAGAVPPPPPGDPEPLSRVFLTGDFNSYTQEDPMQILYDAGYTDIGSSDTDEYSRYNYNVTNFYTPNPYRSSDHDPLLVGFTPPAPVHQAATKTKAAVLPRHPEGGRTALVAAYVTTGNRDAVTDGVVECVRVVDCSATAPYITAWPWSRSASWHRAGTRSRSPTPAPRRPPRPQPP